MSIQSLGKTNTIVLPSKSAQSEKTKGAVQQPSSTPKDSVDITPVAKEITKALETSETSSVNQERIQAVKKALDEGTYSIDAEKIAGKMIQMEQLDNR